jgi:Skp family chaperone for outer membrane proteins
MKAKLLFGTALLSATAAVLGTSLYTSFFSSSSAESVAPPASTGSAANGPASTGVTGLKIGILDKKKLAEEAKVARYVRQKLQEAAEKYQKELASQEKSLQKAHETLLSKRSTLSSEAFQKDQLKLQKKVEEFQKKVEDRRTKMEQASQKADQAVEEKVREILTDLEKKGFQLILWSQSMASSANDVLLDITDQVLETLDKDLPTVALDLEEKKEESKPTPASPK